MVAIYVWTRIGIVLLLVSMVDALGMSVVKQNCLLRRALRIISVGSLGEVLIIAFSFCCTTAKDMLQYLP